MSSSPTTKVVKTDGTYYIEDRPRETVQVLAHHHPANIPGKSLIVALVEQAPNAAAPAHTHSGGALVGMMIEGHVLQRINADESFISGPGDVWYEGPDDHHVVNENASKTERARFFAVIVIDDEVIKDGYARLADFAVRDKESMGG